MKKFLTLFLIIQYCICSIEECNDSEDINSCNSIEIELEDFYCFKKKDVEEDGSQCLVMPKNKENQKYYFALEFGFFKEMFSCFVTHEEETGVSKEEYLKEMEFTKPKKESYNLDEIVEFEKASFTNKDKDILFSEKTCTYYFYGKYYWDPKKIKYEDITDKNVCFNAQQFDDFKNLVDCGYAEMKFSIEGKNYEIKTCFLIPNDNLPKSLNDIYMEFINSEIEGEEGMIKFVFDMVHLNALAQEEEKRRLSTLTYNIEVENKNGKKVKYSSDKELFEVISEGSGEGSGTKEGSGTEEGSGSYLNTSIILIILLIISLSL